LSPETKKAMEKLQQEFDIVTRMGLSISAERDYWRARYAAAVSVLGAQLAELQAKEAK